MSNIAEIYSPGITNKYFGPAVVLKSSDEQGFISVNLNAHQEINQVYARIALQLTSPLKTGDEILVAGHDIDNLYIIGVFPASESPAEFALRHEIGGGAYIKIDESNSTPKLQVFTKRNELVVEYDPVSEKTRINVEKGDLEFSNQNGDIVFDTQQNIRLNGYMIELASHSNIQLSVADAFGQ